MDRPNRLCLSLVALAVVYSGVVSCADERSTATDSADQSPKGVTNQPISDTGQIMDVDEQLSIARQDLARRLRIDTDEIEVETVQQVNWRSGAVGCPEPGMSYTMALVPGVLILLRAGGEVYRYHGGRSGTPFYCPADRAETPVSGQGEEVM